MKLLPPPGPERTRQLAVLGVLVVVLGIYFGRQYWPTAASPAATSKSVVANNGKDKDAKLVLPENVKLLDLDPAPPGSENVRNPFRFGEPPPKPLPPAPPPPPPMPQQEYKPPPPPVPQVPLKCVSILTVTATKQRMASMIDPETGAAAQWMRDGDVFDGRYKIVKVNENSVVVSFLDGTGQKTVPVER